MFVWVVTLQESDYFDVLGIWADKEKATEYAKNYSIHTGVSELYIEVREMEVQ